MTLAPRAAAPFPEGGKRLLVYVVYDRRGDIGAYIPHALRGIRPHVDRILAVVNGGLSDEGRALLEPVVDEVLVRENRGFDIEAEREALAHLGATVEEFDEIVLANDTWYGPIGSFAPVFERMDAAPTHFWGMTEHPEQSPNPFIGTGVMHRHVQSFWIAVRRTMFATEAWRRYWSELPRIESYNDAILLHEAVFTEHFTGEGFTATVAFPAADYPSEHAAIFHADLLMRDGCPLLKRRTLFHHPTFLFRHAIIGRDIVREAGALGYPVELIHTDLARNVAPRTLNADLGMLTVRAEGTAPALPVDAGVTLLLSALRVAHIPQAQLWLDRLPAGSRIVAVAALDEDSRSLEMAWRRLVPAREAEVRSAPSSALHPLAGAADLAGATADVVIRIDAGIWEGDDNARRALRRQQLESLLGPSDAVAGIVDRFRQERGLGLIFPPTPHLASHPEAIRWPSSRGRVAQAAADAGVRVPIDEFGPLAPAAGIWAARPEALRDLPPIVEPGGVVDDGWPLVDLLLPYLVAERGYHSRTITTPEHAALAHTSIEYALDRLLENTYGYRLEQIQFLQRAQWRGTASAVDLIKMHMRINHPDGAHPLLPLVRLGRRGIARASRALRGTAGRA